MAAGCAVADMEQKTLHREQFQFVLTHKTLTSLLEFASKRAETVADKHGGGPGAAVLSYFTKGAVPPRKTILYIYI